MAGHKTRVTGHPVTLRNHRILRMRRQDQANDVGRYSNLARIEGTFTELKLLKRRMYGRAIHDILEARLMSAA